MTAPPDARRSPLGVIGAIWGIGGLVVLLGRSIWKLAPMALEPFEMELAWWHWLLYAVSIIFMAYSEGYKGFQKGFSPRVVARGLHLMRNPKPLHVLLAPAYCMGLFHATRKRMIVGWSVLIGVAILVMIIRSVSQPWRGIVDAGVVVGLSWGTVAIMVFLARVLGGREFDVSPETPGSRGAVDEARATSTAH